MEHQTPESQNIPENKVAADQPPRRYQRYHGIGLVLLIIVVFLLAMTVIDNLTWHRRAETQPPIAAIQHGQMFNRGGLADRPDRIGRPLNHSRLIGAITKVDSNNLTVHSGGKDQVVIISSSTAIYQNGAIAKQSDLATGEAVIVE